MIKTHTKCTEFVLNHYGFFHQSRYGLSVTKCVKELEKNRIIDLENIKWIN